jgi:hypothetical protein
VDKFPAIRPVSVGETWHQVIAKTLLIVAGAEAKKADGVAQLCAGLKAGIEGGTHAMYTL